MLMMDRIELYSRGLESLGLWLAQVGGGSSLADAFRDFYRLAIETVPQFMAAFLVLLVFALAALIAWRATRAAMARIKAAGITIPFPIWTLHLPSGANGANGAENNR